MWTINQSSSPLERGNRSLTNLCHPECLAGVVEILVTEESHDSVR